MKRWVQRWPAGWHFFRKSIMADQLISERVMAIVGNTLLTYQAIEHLMKDIARSVDVSVPITLNPSESKAKAEKIVGKRVKLINASTMGGVVKEYLKLFEPLTFSDDDDAATEGSYRIKFEINTGEAERNTRAKEIEALVAERNWVVHQSLLELNAQEIAVRESAVEKLRACNSNAHKIYSEIQIQAMMHADVRKRMIGPLGEQLQKLMGTMLNVTFLMHDRKGMKPNKDGWVPVERLQTRCREKFGNELMEACAATQTKSVLEFIKKQMGGIEIQEHKTKNGSQLMYRLTN